MDITTIERIKEMINIDADNTTNDLVLSNLINSVSIMAENYMGRKVENTTYTEYFDVSIGGQIYSLKAYPVTSITTVHNDVDWDYDSDTLVDSTSYQKSAETGILYVKTSALIEGFSALKVVYIGGMATCTEELFDDYADLSAAIERQVAFLYKTRTKIGASSVNSSTGGVSWDLGYQWMKDVKGVLDIYKRVTYV